jgi:hypothetical protein
VGLTGEATGPGAVLPSSVPSPVGALTGVAAAVVGVVVNLALYFASHTVFVSTFIACWSVLHAQVSDSRTFRPVALGIVAVTAVLLFRVKWSVSCRLDVALLGPAAGLAELPVEANFNGGSSCSPTPTSSTASP